MLTYAGKGESATEPIDITEVVREMAHLVDAAFSRKVDLRQDFVENLPAVEVDASQFRQVVMNLVNNASEAIGDANGVVSISTGVVDASQEFLANSYVDDELPAGIYVFVEVVDSGRGMDRETQEKIFDPFFSTKFPGRGLGLGASLGIVRSHSGAIQVNSEPGKGSTFRVLFPATDTPVKNTPTLPEEAARWSGAGTTLVVDDEVQVREVAWRMLERMGFDVKTAADGKEALEVFREHADEIDCVLLDVAMPRMGGEETFLELKRVKPDVRVVLASGFGEEDIQRRFAGKGLAGFFEKPYAPAELRKMMKEVLSK
jgi:CheY-like chemotaxis protein